MTIPQLVSNAYRPEDSEEKMISDPASLVGPVSFDLIGRDHGNVFNHNIAVHKSLKITGVIAIILLHEPPEQKNN